MKERSKAGGRTGKAGRHKVAPPKRAVRQTATPHRHTSAVSQADNARLTRERDEALEREKASAEVLRIISTSPGELKPIFQAMLENAVRICEAVFGNLYLRDADGFHMVAAHHDSPAYVAARMGDPLLRPPPDAPLGQLAITKEVVQVADIRTLPSRDHPFVAAGVKAGYRTVLAIPLLKDGELIGAFTVIRQKVQAFTEKQIALLENFASQAVIAIENTRLLSELRQRTADLSESLDQQTATSDVLKVISSARGELSAVFEAILSNATRICEATYGNLLLRENGGFRRAAQCNAPQELIDEFQRNPVFVPLPNNPLDRVLKTKETVHTVDAQADSNLGPLANARTLLNVPMLSHDELIGTISIYRQEVSPFTDKQIALMQNFAAQAVIAIENARLLNELRQSLEQQTATADVLRVISSSPGELEPVFEAMLENATRLCAAEFGDIFRFDGNAFHFAAHVNTPPQLADFQKHRGPFLPLEGGGMDRMMRTKQVIQVADNAAEPVPTPAARFGGARSTIWVPMLKDNEFVGGIVIYRQEVRPFIEKEIALVQNFAAQAVIAIENARLLNELRESLERQTATADVLRVISSSPGNLQPVFEAMLQNAVQICDARFGNLALFEGDGFRFVAHYGAPEKYLEAKKLEPFIRRTRGNLDRVIKTKQVVHVVDVATEEEPNSAIVKLAGARTLVDVPMLKDDELIGIIVIYRQEVRPFTDKQIELLQNFAAQAVIAIENARLLDDLNKLNRQLEHRVTDQVGEIERMSRLRRFLPPQVADLIVASGSEKQLESHRREITALFCDLRGFTGFSESSDPEDVMALLRDYHAAIGKIIIKYSGTLERYAGDGVMVVFNDPVPVENPALQAVLMALEMRDAIGALTETWHRWGHDIGFGIGIAHGFATLGTIGFEGRFDYAAIGTVSNVASRLCDEAKPGQILINPRVLTKVENAVTVEPVGEFTLKGIRRPMVAYNVLAASPYKPN